MSSPSSLSLYPVFLSLPSPHPVYFSYSAMLVPSFILPFFHFFLYTLHIFFPLPPYHPLPSFSSSTLSISSIPFSPLFHPLISSSLTFTFLHPPDIFLFHPSHTYSIHSFYSSTLLSPLFLYSLLSILSQYLPPAVLLSLLFFVFLYFLYFFSLPFYYSPLLPFLHLLFSLLFLTFLSLHFLLQLSYLSPFFLRFP